MNNFLQQVCPAPAPLRPPALSPGLLRRQREGHSPGDGGGGGGGGGGCRREEETLGLAGWGGDGVKATFGPGSVLSILLFPRFNVNLVNSGQLRGVRQVPRL